MKTLFDSFYNGLKDSLRADRIFQLFFKSKLIRERALAVLLMNGVLFLGSMLLYSILIAPIANWLRMPGFVEYFFSILFYALWLCPLQLMSMILNIFWVQDIYDEGSNIFKIQFVKNRSKLKFQTRISNEIIRALILFLYQLQIHAIGLIIPRPFSWLICTAHLAWFYSFQSFEYRCYAENKTVDESIAWVEENWAYFLGFGVIPGIILPYFPGIWGSAVFMLIFPYFVLASIKTRIYHSLPNAPPQPKLPIFALALALNKRIFHFAKEYLNKYQERQQEEPKVSKVNKEQEMLDKIQRDIELTESILLKQEQSGEMMKTSEQEEVEKGPDSPEPLKKSEGDPEKWVLINSSLMKSES